MRVNRRRTLSGMAIAALLALTGPALGQSVENFYEGNTLTMIVSAPAGSLTDTIARQFAPYYGQHIPGKPDVVVVNLPGAGGIVAASSLQYKQDSDGSVVGFLQRNNLYVPLLDKSQKTFDPRGVDWIGSLDKVYYCIIAMTRSGVTDAAGLFDRKLIIGATGFSNENRTLPSLVNKYLNTRMEIIPGYSDRGEVYLAMQRDEVDGWASTVDGLARGEPARMLADGTMKVLLHLGWESHPDYPDVPNLSDYVTDPKVKSLFNFFLLPFQAGRPLAVPKGVPEDRLAALRAAFDAAVVDPDFLKSMAAQDYGINPINGAAVADVVRQLYETPDDVLDNARDIIKNP